ncbi:MAG: tetratricopeptide repeat protein [Planctomycetes bacterium]|nr:tetratricopeptide repeat protein [Planctomycetota bacterium]MCB9868979.1 tetratricopeptide repeat protein [Planctomycetota bacterium]MCB9887941.1 tetratricopeptide repeat protein [Planctomycetota bacterium]
MVEQTQQTQSQFRAGIGRTIDTKPGNLPAGSFATTQRRIQEIPELIVAPGTEQIRGQVTEALQDIGARLTKVHETAAEAYLSQEMYSDAVRHVEASVALDANNVDKQNHLGYVRYLAGDDVGALHAFDTVLSLDGANADALFNVGMIAFSRGDLETAEASFRACTQIDTNNSELWNNLGVVLVQRSQSAAAKACFETALSLDSNNEDAIFNLQHL